MLNPIWSRYNTVDAARSGSMTGIILVSTLDFLDNFILFASTCRYFRNRLYYRDYSPIYKRIVFWISPRYFMLDFPGGQQVSLEKI